MNVRDIRTNQRTNTRERGLLFVQLFGVFFIIVVCVVLFDLIGMRYSVFMDMTDTDTQFNHNEGSRGDQNDRMT